MVQTFNYVFVNALALSPGMNTGNYIKLEFCDLTVKAPPELSKRVSTIRSTTTHHPTVSAPSTCTSALNQDW
ncbi:UNVERIFIED_CONTAM: hypothetical protein FKN15_007451 [Acipenser sinensis]